MKKLITETINESVDLDGVILEQVIKNLTSVVNSNTHFIDIRFDVSTYESYGDPYTEINIIGSRYETDDEEFVREKTVEYNEKSKRDAEFKQYQKLKEKFETKE